MKIRDLFEERVFTISNFLTVLRITVIPFILYHFFAESATGRDEHRKFQLIFFSVIVATDFFDGFIARTFNQVSNLGQFLDPLSDKICLLSIGGALVYFKGFPCWVFLIAIVRELFVFFVSFFLYSRRGVGVRPNVYGKLGVASMAFSAFLYIGAYDIRIPGDIHLKNVSIVLILLFYFVGLIIYAKEYSRRFLEK